MPPLLTVSGLQTCFGAREHQLCAVNDVSLSIDKGSTVALVGESGSGKSLTAFSIMRLVPSPGLIRSGSIHLEEVNLLALSEEEMRSIRGRRISMVFQEPMTSLNPVLRIGEQIMEPLMLHLGLKRKAASRRAAELLRQVGIPSPDQRLADYPHQLSGGMRQRVMIAMALACNPALLIADEPTTALDVTIQAQILELIDTLRRDTQMGILLITHDLGIVAERSDHTYVMYAGRILECGPTAALLGDPQHPYTQALLAALPQNAEPGRPLTTLPGHSSAALGEMTGCGFCERCPVFMERCRQELPPWREVAPDHKVRCWRTTC